MRRPKAAADAVMHKTSALFRFISYWVPVVIYAIFIFLVSAVPGKDVPDLFPKQDILFHAVEYAIFAFLVSRAVKEYYSNQRRGRRLFWVFSAVIAYAALDEIHQSFVPYRTASMFDVMIDGAGCLIGSIIYR